jgi:acyl-CoA synthetase (AMP-forming)/AMP-acid ligase II
MGRLDQQVKVAGYRVEPGEAEAALRDLPDAVALALEQSHGGIELHGVCTGENPEPGTLLDELRLRLPAYMVPRTLRVLAELLLNGNDRTDRCALAALLSP